jgi:hypothetical protein
MIGSDLDAEQDLGTMIVKGEGRIDSDTNINELRDFSNKERRCQRREVAADCPLSHTPSSASCWGLVDLCDTMTLDLSELMVNWLHSHQF